MSAIFCYPIFNFADTLDIVFQPDDTHNGICRWMIWLQTDEVNAHRGINFEYSIDGGYNVLTDPSGTIMIPDGLPDNFTLVIEMS